MTIINNALSGAVAAQASLSASSQNIANLQTKGYTRQGVLLTAVTAGYGAQGAGSGVKLSSMLRFSDSYKTQQMWRANAELGQRSQVQPYLTQLEQVMGDDKSSISNGVDNFFKSLNAVAEDPTSGPLRGQVVTAATSLSETFNSIYAVTRNQQLSVDQQRASVLPKFNTLVQNIASLNERITAAGAIGTNTSGLVDERDVAIDALSQLASIEVLEQPDGSRTVSLKSGQPLVVGKMAGSLFTDTTGGTPVLKANFANSSYVIDDAKMGGQLGGLGNYERNTLLPLQTSIREMAEQLATAVNTQLAAGSTPAGVTGKPIFQLGGGGAGGVLSVPSDYQSTDLAFAAAGEPAGDSSNLQLLIGIKQKSITLSSVGSVAIGDADTQLVGKLAIDSQQNQSLLATATTIRRQAEDDWSATSGVNRDEEAINLVEFQNMYQANMKVLAVANTLFDATLAMLG